MKKILLTGLFAALIVAAFAQKPYKVVFYNFENLFDTIRNPEIYDEEFTPEGPQEVEFDEVQQEAQQPFARIVRHRGHGQGLSGGDRLLGDREPQRHGGCRLDAQARAGTVPHRALRFA